MGVTQQGEKFNYEGWKNACGKCDSIAAENIWKLDTIHNDYILLSRTIEHDSAWKFDTITPREEKKYREYARHWYYQTTLDTAASSWKDARMVYAFPIAFDRRKITLDSIQSFSFARDEKCSGFGLELPLFCLAAAIGAPIAASDGEGFDWRVFAAGELLAAYVFYTMYRAVTDMRVKTYDLNKWKIKTH